MANSQYLIPRIEAVRPVLKVPSVLSWRFAGGESGRVDLSDTIRGKRALAKLRDADLFRRAKPSEHSFGVVWPVPKTVTLALAGWEAQHTRLAA